MARTQNVGRPTYAQGTPGHLQETKQINKKPVFSDQELDAYFDTIENPNTISKERLKRYLNIIETTDAGRNILTTLKTLMNGKKICIVESDTASKVRNQLSDKLKYISANNISLNFLIGLFPGLWSQEQIISIFFEKGENIADILLQQVNLLDNETLMNIVESFVRSDNEELMDIGKILKDSSQAYEFNSEKNIILINQDLLAKERLAFDGENIVSIDLERMLGSKDAVEAYFFTHELVHYIQFLSNENNIMGGKDDKDWKTFLQTTRMQPIYNALQKKYSDDEIYKAFRILFQNVEEARNLLGFVPENRQDLPAIGEFFLFNKENNYCLPVYYDMEGLTQEQQATCKDVLNTIAKKLGIHFQNDSMTVEGMVVASNGKKCKI